jgi:hypothetical protein
MRVLVYQYFDEFNGDCDGERSQIVNDGLVSAYEKLVNEGLETDTFDNLICSQIDVTAPETSLLNIKNGTVIFYDSSQPEAVALFKLDKSSVSKQAVKDIVLRMHELTAISGKPGYYQDTDGNEFNADKTVKSGICPAWIPVFLRSVACNQYGCPSWMPHFLCNNNRKPIKWLLLLMLVLAVFFTYKKYK